MNPLKIDRKAYLYVINLQIYVVMFGKTPNKHQVTIFQTPLVNFINMDHELVHLAQHIDWDEVENEFKGYFSENGRPSVPVRRMVGLMLLKSLYNLSDESTVARWVESPYFQYFTGEYMFQIKPPIDPADFSKFRRRVGEEGAEKLLKLSINVNADEMTNNTEVMVDTTVQEKNITFTTNVKLYRKIIAKCHKVAKDEIIVLRRNYVGDTKVEIPGSGEATDSYYKKQKAKNKFRRWAGIEPVIGHLKQDYRMPRNYLKGNVGGS